MPYYRATIPPMKAILAALLLMGPLGLLPALAQTSPPDAMTALGSSAKGDGAFTLAIDAPGEVREVLERNLDVLRYRGLNDLSDSELARLLLAAEQDARELVATLGYFSPTITVEPPVSPSGAVPRSLRLRVVPGVATVVTDVQITFAGFVDFAVPQTWQPWLIDGPQYGPFLTRLDVGKKVLVLHAAARFDPLLHEVFRLPRP